MKKRSRSFRRLLTEGLLAAAALFLLLTVCNSFSPAQPDLYTSRRSSTELQPLTGLSADSLLNAGDLSTLDDLPGIGKVLAGRIIETRERDGLFFFPEDIMTVSGIGEKRFADIMNYLSAHPATATDLNAD